MTDTNRTTRTCSIEGCDRPGPFKRGWCNLHYLRWKRHGDPLLGRRVSPRTPREAFDLYSEKRSGGCWEWTGLTDATGYGALRFRGRRWQAHRAAWTLVNGKIPEGMDVNHICWNRACVNVEHLNLATRSENLSYRQGPDPDNTSGYRNVYWHEKGQCWFVKVVKEGKQHYKFGFKTAEEAAVYAEWLREHLNGEFAGKG